MELVVYNPHKGRLETIDVAITQDNTTWFQDCQDHAIHTITDCEDGLLIRERGYSYPLLIYDIARADIGYDQRKAKLIYRRYPEGSEQPPVTDPD